MASGPAGDGFGELLALFDELESQAQAAYERDREGGLVDLERAEYADVTLASRLMASLDRDITLGVTGLGTVRGRLERVARGWLMLRTPGQDVLVRTEAVTGAEGVSERAVPDVAWPATSRLGLGSALRRLAEARERCVLVQRDGTRDDGTVRRVGKDFVELATGEPERLRLVATARLAAVLSRQTAT